MFFEAFSCGISKSRCATMARVGDTEGNTVLEGNWSDAWGGTPGEDVLAAALEETEAKASKLDLENARLRLALVPFSLRSLSTLTFHHMTHPDMLCTFHRELLSHCGHC